MSVIKITNSFASMADAKLEEKADFIVSQMTGNAAFPTPDPTLAAVQTAITAFSDAVSAAWMAGQVASLMTIDPSR